jgi:hypothetical protein
MTRIRRFAVFFVVMSWAAIPPAVAQISSSNFEIDDTKPFVYLKFDHLGSRKPVNDSESSKGLWLRLVNNCRLPISISVLDPGTGDPGVIVNYEVVPVPGWNVPDSEQRKKMPFGLEADIGTLVTISPGGSLLFSVPAESVTAQWYIQVRFDFVFPAPKSRNYQPSGNYEPYSVADFTWYNIPEKYRPNDAASQSR